MEMHRSHSISRHELQKHPDFETVPVRHDRQASDSDGDPNASPDIAAEASASCPVCGTGNAQPLCTVDGYRIARCAQCAADFVSPAPDDAMLRAYYDRPAWFEGGERGGYRNYDEQTAPLLPFFDAILDEFGPNGGERSVLDVGCGYGTHLERAHQRGWKCFGVEVSAHARQVIGERHGHKFFIADDVDNIIPHEFDLIVMFDVIEHLADPYRLFYSLFAKGAITPKTTVLIATPNARSADAVANPAGWQYRHPPSHLTYFSAQALTILLQRLHFHSVEIQGMHAETVAGEVPAFDDESFPLNDKLSACAGLFCRASGSDFAEFMQERYVPGTWSRIAEYEHLPRYLFARELARGRKVLDFGCGTGYGTSILAQKAKSVIGIDIDAAALEWARGHHRKHNLSYEQRGDLGASLPAASFDFITCFEMIEHVPETLQIETVRNFARLLTKEGLAAISTPNPEITKLYGENPYHIREMDRAEFEELLREHFQYVEFFQQYIQPSVYITPEGGRQNSPIRSLTWAPVHETSVEPAVFIAICSHSPIAPPDGSCYLDFRVDFIKEQLRASEQLSHTQLDYFRAAETATGASAIALETAAQLQDRNLRVAELESELHGRHLQVMEFEATLQEFARELHARNLRVTELEAALHERNLQVMERDTRLIAIDALLQAARTELDRYSWVRKIDRALIKR